MNSDEEVLATVDEAFGSVARPQHFTVEDGDPECMDHDALLKARTPQTLTLADVGNSGWDPMCECLPPGFAYFLPALARFALADLDYAEDHLLFHLSYGGAGNRFLAYCNPLQRAAVAALLSHIIATRHAMIEQYNALQTFAECLSLWSAERR